MGRPMTIRNTLTILAGCPTGATWDALRTRGISRTTLNRLVDRGLVARLVATTSTGD